MGGHDASVPCPCRLRVSLEAVESLFGNGQGKQSYIQLVAVESKSRIGLVGAVSNLLSQVRLRLQDLEEPLPCPLVLILLS